MILAADEVFLTWARVTLMDTAPFSAHLVLFNVIQACVTLAGAIVFTVLLRRIMDAQTALQEQAAGLRQTIDANANASLDEICKMREKIVGVEAIPATLDDVRKLTESLRAHVEWPDAKPTRAELAVQIAELRADISQALALRKASPASMAP